MPNTNAFRGAIASLVLAFAAATLFFWPALGHDRILAIGDGLIEALPGFVASADRWQSAMLVGFPIYADSSKAYWYPLRLLRYVPDGFNAYVISAYAIAAWATYGYARNVTGFAIAGVASAASFTLGGFMISHVGHPMIAQPAAWACVSIWSLDLFIRRGRGRWLLAMAAAEALAISSGQPQIAAFTIALLFAYLVWFGYGGRTGRTLRVYAWGAGSIALGVLIGAAALVPTIVLGTSSVRAGIDFGSFVAYELPLAHLARMLTYPFAIGGGATGTYAGAIVPPDAALFVEASCYVGLGALALAVVGAFAPQRRLAIFWTAVAIIGIVLAIGDATPLAAITYALPGFNVFRIPGRHAFEFTLAISNCAALGVASIAARAERRFALPLALAAIGIVCAIATADVASQAPGFAREPAIVVFVVAFALAIVLVSIVAVTRGMPRTRSALACAAVLAGTLPFAATAYWRDAPDRHVLDRPAYVRLLERLPLARGERVYTASGNGTNELEPNLPTTWGVRDVGGYTPLQFATVHILLQTGLEGRLLDVASPLVDLASVRYLAVPARPEAVITAAARFDAVDLQAFLSIGRPEAPRTVRFGLARPERANRIALVTALGASVGVPQGTTVAIVTVRERSGRSESLPLRAGIETAEFAYERADVLPNVRHGRAPTYERVGPNTWYVVSLPVRLRGEIVSVEIRMVERSAALNVRKISLVDTGADRAYPFSDEAPYLGDAKRFRHIADEAGVAVFENLRRAPPVWIAKPVPTTLATTDDAALATFRERLRAAPYTQVAFVSDSAVPRDVGSGTADLVVHANEHRVVAVDCRGSCLLVASETFSNDWHVEVDGHREDLVRVDGMLQGVFVGAGHHTVDFRYRPTAGRIGVVVSIAAASLLVLALGIRRRRDPERRVSETPSAT